MTLKRRLKKMCACGDAVRWVGERTLKTAWAECERGDWMLWFAARANCDRKKLVFAACQCARIALNHVPKGELRPLAAIETAEKWCRDEATSDEVKIAASSAASAAAHAARITTREQCAEIVRAHINLTDLKKVTHHD